ncbi:hypothetical protein [Bifidobacterium oedipodis]|uniref:Uncharacterized protein n=1 Tax=Bifidobacterium oedipodis TaxID=2675322 RepID=A0A7Y0HTP3_9BIFI|nr:hypothetical protein [Bifidobacterium sp. DSM 109957]NMM93904.1 hypothetical protein [Bifidobacterium sp. DSM 109957]
MDDTIVDLPFTGTVIGTICTVDANSESVKKLFPNLSKPQEQQEPPERQLYFKTKDGTKHTFKGSVEVKDDHTLTVTVHEYAVEYPNGNKAMLRISAPSFTEPPASME